jgi:hypothetical protein
MRPEKYQYHRIYIYGGIFISVLMIIVAMTISSNRTSLWGRAAAPGGVTYLSIANSYIFSSPTSAVADGSSVVRITVVILDNQGLGMKDQKVNLKILEKTGGKEAEKVKVTPTSPVTNSLGTAVFDITSSSPGEYIVVADSSGATLTQTGTLTFR